LQPRLRACRVPRCGLLVPCAVCREATCSCAFGLVHLGPESQTLSCRRCEIRESFKVCGCCLSNRKSLTVVFTLELARLSNMSAFRPQNLSERRCRLACEQTALLEKTVDLESVLTKCPVTGIPVNSVGNNNRQHALNLLSPRLVAV